MIRLTPAAREGPQFTAFLAAVLMILLAASPAWAIDEALKPLIGLAGFVNETGEPSNALIGRTATDTMELTLRLLGAYRVERVDPGEPTPEALAAFAAERGCDSIIVGAIRAGAERGYVLEARLFDLRTGSFTIESLETADFAIDIFDASDRLVISFLEKVAGVHLGFGRLGFVNSGEPGRYVVRLNGEDFGTDLQSLEKVLNGEYVITVAQERMFGEHELARLECVLLEGGEAVVEFAVPYALAEESALVDSLVARATEGARTPSMAIDAREALNELTVRLSSTPYSPRLADRLAEGERLRASVEASALRLEVESFLFDPLSADAGLAGSILDRFADDPGIAELTARVNESAALLACLLELEAARLSRERDTRGFLEAYERIERLAGALPEAERFYYTERGKRLVAATAALDGGTIRGRPLAPYVLGGGLAFSGIGLAMLAANADGMAVDRAEDLYAEYRAASTPEAATALHRDVEFAYAVANVMGIYKWAGSAGGLGVAGLGLLGILTGKPEDFYWRMVDGLFAPSLAAADRFDAIVAAGLPDGSALVLSADTERPWAVADMKEAPLPVLVPLPGAAVAYAGKPAAGSLDPGPERGNRLVYLPCAFATREFKGWMLGKLWSDPAWLRRAMR